MSNNSNKTLCTDCASPLGRSLWTFLDKGDYKCDSSLLSNAGGCPKNARLCTKCYHKHPLLIVDKGQDPNDISKGKIHRFCLACFQEKSTLDFSRPYDRIDGAVAVAAPTSSASNSPEEVEIDPSSNSHCSKTIFVFVHGGSSSRALLHAHAMELKERYGHSSILLDLPGHGTLAENDTVLNLESCAKTLEKVLTECNIMTAQSKKKTSSTIIYVGGSLGAYLGFYLLQLDQFKNIFDGAVLMDCGQNVGPGASFQAKAGLVLLSWLGSTFSNATLMKMMLDVTTKSPTVDYKLVETVFGAGWFFQQAAAQVECLRTVHPAKLIPNITCPILYMNGSKDYRDSENKWLELSNNNKPAGSVASELKVYPDGDHFFMHDSRFVHDVLESIDSFAQEVSSSNAKK